MTTIRAAAFVAVFQLTLMACAQDQDAGKREERRSAMMADDLGEELRAEEARIKERRTRIDAELAAMDRAALPVTDWAKEWAGVYYTGDGLGENVSIHLAPKAGISFLNYGCLGLYGGDHGEVVEPLPDGLRLKLAFGSRNKSFLSERVYFVKWGDERFLVPDWQMRTFVNNYNKGGYSRTDMFGIARKEREGAPARRFLPEDMAPKGRPELPAEYAKMLLDKPTRLKVVRIKMDEPRVVTELVRVHEGRIEFEGGMNKGVFVGMEFDFPYDEIGRSYHIAIKECDASSCKGTIRAFLGAGEEKARPPVAGQSLSTGEGSPRAADEVAPEKK